MGITTNTVGDELDLIQTRLHDGGAIWPRTELLNWWNDSYAGLIIGSGAVRRLTPFDVPYGVTTAITYDWERRYAGGTWKKFTRTVAAGSYEATSLWEGEDLAAVTPTASWGSTTYDWERESLGDSDTHLTFVFPQNHDRVLGIYYNDRRLEPIGVRSLDQSDTTWWTQVGQPRWWTTGTGPIRTVEIYQIQTAVTVGYAYSNTYPYGIPRSFSGSRTYSVDGSAYGLVRQMLAPDRQYLPIETDLYPGGGRILGRIVEWRSSDGALLVYHVVGPDRDLIEADVPSLLPSPAMKYVRYGVLAACFGRQGEGHQSILRDHYARRFDLGVKVFKRLANLAFRDRVYTRTPSGERPEVPALVRLPDTFERVWT